MCETPVFEGSFPDRSWPNAYRGRVHWRLLVQQPSTSACTSCSSRSHNQYALRMHAHLPITCTCALKSRSTPVQYLGPACVRESVCLSRFGELAQEGGVRVAHALHALSARLRFTAWSVRPQRVN